MYNRIIMHKRPKYGFTTAADMLCKLARVADCLTIDGTYIDVLRSDNYDCRAGDGKYGIGLHCLTSLKTGTIVGFSVTPAACNERLYVQIEQLANVLIMADRGYPSFQIFADLIRRGASHGVKFIFRAVPCFTMDVLNAVNADGQPVNLTAVNGAVDTSNRANHTIDMIVRMHRPKDSKVHTMAHGPITLPTSINLTCRHACFRMLTAFAGSVSMSTAALSLIRAWLKASTVGNSTSCCSLLWPPFAP